ncbi:MAG: glycerol-3-phosphate 1-O-acyltransferase PlsY [Coleofasciculus sp. G1-WW12-02]|uniref:glycerol-3-phosphate 1-O-acyltransferase PlsY n=1 Tax=Coleofasciculus sp. G1-WW12-02 TaxID=3068483 RepID=UPI0033048DD3
MMRELSWIGLLLITAYLLGSIPTGYLAGRLVKGIDIREVGSGSTGATNVLRNLGKGPAFVVLLIDAAKGVGAVALVHGFFSLTGTSVIPDTWKPWLVAVVALVAMVGHSKSIWINFTGGKSAATGLGVLLAMSWFVALSVLVIFIGVVGFWRFVSLGSIAAAIAVAVLMIVLAQPLPYQIFGVMAGLYVILRHQANIQRLLAGTEPRLGQSVSPEVISS